MSKPTEPGGGGSGRDGVFTYRRRVGFGETDSARIAYTAELPRFALEAIEAWFIERLDVSWYEINVQGEFGTPFVHLSMDFRAPVTPRHPLIMSVLLEKAGQSSLTLKVEGRSADRLCFEGRFVSVFVDSAGRRPIPIPERCREAVAREAAVGGVAGNRS